jgi:hypothetical protein
MSTREKIRSYIDDGPALLLEPEAFDVAIIGLAERCGQPTLVAYDRQRCIEVLMADGMDHDEAEEFFEFNTAGAWVGEGTPIFIDTRWVE